MSSSLDLQPEDDPVLREALKRCSPATYYAACKFKKSGHAEDLNAVVLGLVERFTERELRTKLSAGSESLRLREDLGLDSLTMMEIVMIAEEVLPMSVSNEELTKLRTLGDVQAFVLAKVTQPTPDHTSAKARAENGDWNIAAVGEDVRRIEAKVARSASPLAP